MDLFKHLHVKIVSLCVGVILWCAMGAGAYAYSYVVIGNLKYTLNENNCTATVKGHTDGLTKVEIPSSITYEDVVYSVTTIGAAAFSECTSLTSVTIPNSVTVIGHSAFAHCTRLTSVTIPNSVTEIMESSFLKCTSLTSVNIPNSVTVIGGSAFGECTSLTSVTIPNSVTTIGEQAFLYCTSLKNVKIPDSVSSIKSYTFNGCSSLISITISNGVTEIGKHAFERCTSLTSVNIPNSVTKIGEWAFNECTSLTNVAISNNVTKIEDYTFQSCTSLKSVTIPNGVTSIGSTAFSRCSSLTNVTIPDGVMSIGRTAFNYCSSLTCVNIPNSVTEIGIQAFEWCTSLKSVTIPNSVTVIEGGTFYCCTSLDSITIPNSVTVIGGTAFSCCDSLKSITIPNSVMEIEEYAFSGCTSLTSVTIPHSVTEIGAGAFKGCYSLKIVVSLNLEPPTLGSKVFSAKTVFVPAEAISTYKAADGWKEYNIEDVAHKDFAEFKIGGINYLVISFTNKKVEATFGENDYSGNIEIPKVVIYDKTDYTVSDIGSYAFRACPNLTSITIPNSVTEIGDYAFMECPGLESITCTSEDLTLGEYVFYNDTAIAYVPAASAALYNSLDWGTDDAGKITIEYLNDYTRNTQAGAFGTLCLPYDYTPEGATLYGIESVEGDKVILTAVEGNQGLANKVYIYQATKVEQNFPYIPGTPLDTELKDVTMGVLTSPAQYSVVPDGCYTLQTRDSVQAFYKVDGETYIMPHRAYLTPDAIDSSRDGLSLQFVSDEGNQAGLETIRALTQGTSAIYDLNGRRLSMLQKGLNIVDGVKVFVK